MNIWAHLPRFSIRSGLYAAAAVMLVMLPISVDPEFSD